MSKVIEAPPMEAASPTVEPGAAVQTGPYVPAGRGAEIPATLPEAECATISPTELLPPATPPPVLVPGFEILGVLGRGGMGVVYQARQTGLNRLVALKMILAGGHAGASELARFRTEGEAVARLQHPNVVQIYEVGEADGLPYFALEFCAGGALDKRLRGTPLPPNEAAQLVQTLARAMQAAHQRDVVHRDLKPANVLLAADGTPKVTDFGLAKRLDEVGHTASGAVLGTPSYMAPEQAEGKGKAVGPAADGYALGAILYECLTGRPPFRAATALDTILQVMADEPVPPRQLNAQVPLDLETICLKCLQKDPAKRYASAALLADDLRRFLAQEPILARPVAAPERLVRWCRRNRTVASLLATTAAVLVVGIAVAASLAFVAYQRAKKIESINNDLVEANLKRTEEAANANEQRQLAMKTLETVIFEIQSKLANIPNVQPVRGRLLKTALAGLQDISGKLGDQQRVDRNTAVATLHLAEVFRQVGNESEFKGATAATQLYDRALKMFEHLVESSEDAATARRDLANACLLYAINLSHSDDSGWEISAEQIAQQKKRPLIQLGLSLHMRAIELCRQLRAAAPSDPNNSYELAKALTEWAYLELRGGDANAALQGLQDSYSLLKQLLVDQPNEVAYRLLFAKTAERIGDWYFDLKEDDTNCEPFYRQSLDTTRQLAAERPDDEDVQFNYANAWSRIGDMLELQGDLPKALDAFERELAITVKLEQAAPDNVQTLWDASVSYDHVGRISTVLGRYEDAVKVTSKSFAMRLPLLDADPDNRRGHSMINRTTYRLGALYQILGQDQKAIETYEGGLKRLDKFAARTGDRSLVEGIQDIRSELEKCRKMQPPK